MKTINPHDKFFKEAFSKKEEAGDLIKNVLPEGLSNNIDVSTLQLDSTSYIDEELQESFSDLVYNCVYKGKTKIKITLLIEHKSYAVDYPHLQLLKYLQKIWEANIKQKTALVPVIPILVYHGKEKWDKIKFEDYFPGIDNELKQFLVSIFHYVFSNTVIEDKEIVNAISLISEKGGNIAMTTATKLINKGKLEGKQEDVVKLFTKIGLSVEQIANTLDLDKSFVEMALKEQGLI
ncbi:MAG: Rpn family recombination-promoting nuclease/putative transposase [Bacteroidales bacterium]|nr:Rpn family recombination-promoting nuclease/putative transposase [Bacteroidales bacterium]MCF8456529.1 Rpn family recombination-promoting nuclease/putative transposase [Bacteroidales bacterium]